MHHDRTRRTRFVGKSAERAVPTSSLNRVGFAIAPPTLRKAIKGSRTPTDAGLPASPSGEARTLRRARSPVGVPLRLSPGRQLVPKARRQAMLPGTVRSVWSLTAAPTGERRPCACPRVLPAPKQSQCSEHLTRRSLCRQDDARAARERGDEPSPAGTAIPLPASHSSVGWRPCTKSEMSGFYSLFLVVSSIVV
jgi:hypothetical protein